MVFESLANTLLFAVVTGAVISGITVLAATTVKFSFRKFLYSVGIAGISALVIVEAAENGVTADNAIQLFLEVVGLSYLGNKLFSVGKKLKDTPSSV